ncbi:MAG TPA: FixH family protein [Terriglobales bacterium]|nr:FixH family protein [Terriglobales bacterium]
MKRTMAIAALLALALLGCERSQKPAETKKAPAAGAIIAERVEGTSPWKVALALDPAQPKNLKPVGFRFTVTGADGKPATGLAAEVSLVMPLMDMGKNEFPAKEVAPGVYQGSGTFGMADEWEVFLNLSQADQRATHVFNIRVSE